ncbi:MAG: hypothetical protein MI924_01750 [Chloroflexales bacterium]|nr:hypothetical protein [Chloroflexales bacterium]
MPKVVTISDIAATRTTNTHGVRADVNGKEVWFESSTVNLRPAPEAFASAFLIPSIAARARLELDAPVCSDWHEHFPQVLQLIHEWWGYPQIQPNLTVDPTPQAATTSQRSGLCFSGGVDSFFSLLRGDWPINMLIFVHGYDIALHDQARLDAFTTWLERIGQATDSIPVVVRTNLREHASFASTVWSRTHGGALAAIGHLLSDHIDQLVISSSYPFKDPHPWGTHWELDPLWSSARLQVRHYGAQYWRTEKLRAIASEPLVRENLRVCWKKLTSDLNCSRCEKCLRTQLVLLTCRQLERYTVFDQKTPLAERIDTLPWIDNAALLIVYQEFVKAGLPADVEKAVIRLIERSTIEVENRQNYAIQQQENRLGQKLRTLLSPVFYAVQQIGKRL